MLKALMLIATTGVLAGCSMLSGGDEPRYQLRSATYWIERLGRCGGRNELFGSALSRSCRKPVQAIRSMGPAAVPACVRALKSQRAGAYAGAMAALWIYGPIAKSAIPALVDLLVDFDRRNGPIPSGTGNLEATDSVVATLMNIDPQPKETLPRLMMALRQAEPVPPASALPSARHEAAINTLRWRIWRIEVAYAAARLDPGNGAALAVLLDSLEYADPELRSLSAEQREKLKHGTPLFDESGHFVRRGGEPVAVIDVRDAALREQAARALQLLTPVLVPLMSDANPDVVKRIASAFKSMGANAVPDLLSMMRRGQDPILRRNAILALGEVGAAASTAVESLRLLREDEDEIVRAHADSLLKKLDAGYGNPSK